jgi:hypothetical protein
LAFGFFAVRFFLDTSVFFALGFFVGGFRLTVQDCMSLAAARGGAKLWVIGKCPPPLSKVLEEK